MPTFQAMRDPLAYVSAENVARAVDNEPHFRNKVIIRTLFRGGMRVSELIGILKKNILWKENCVVIPWLKKRHKSGRREVRIIPLDSNTMEMIHSWIRIQHDKHEERLFPLDRVTVYWMVRKAFERCGIMWVGINPPHPPHPHTLRHSYATHRVGKTGGDYSKLRKIQLDMGHASIGTTASYLQVLPGELHRGYDEDFSDLD